MRPKKQRSKDVGQAIKEYLVTLTIFIFVASILISLGPSKIESIANKVSEKAIEKETPKLRSLIDLLKEGKSMESLKWDGFTVEDFYANGIVTLHDKPITEWEDLNIEAAFYLFNHHYSSVEKVISLSEEGDVYARKCLSIWYETRFEEIKDIILEKVAYYQQLLENKENEKVRSEGLYQLAWYHAQGIVFKKDVRLALEMYQQSAALGNDKAKLQLFEFYHLGIGMNKPDSERGLKYIQELVAKNHSQAIRLIGSYYQAGPKKDRNLKKAVDFFARSGGLGCTDGMLGLGFCYFHGLSVMVKNVNHAMGLFLKAASLGNSLALYNLAILVKNGQGRSYIRYERIRDNILPHDENISFRLMETAAAMGCETAMYGLARYYNGDIGIERINREEGKRWYQRATERDAYGLYKETDSQSIRDYLSEE